MSLSVEDLKILSAPFDENTISVKVQSFSKDKTKALLVCYVQHTDAYARLEQVDPSWSVEISQVLNVGETTFVRVKLTVKGVVRENAGEGEDLKSATSDAIKRAAMLFGVGRYLYDSESVWVPYKENEDRFREWTYADYKANLRKSKPKTATPGASPVKAVTSPKPKEEFHMPSTREELSPAIFSCVEKLGLSQPRLNELIYEEFKTDPKSLTVPQMQRLYDFLLTEIGRAGEEVKHA